MKDRGILKDDAKDPRDAKGDRDAQDSRGKSRRRSKDPLDVHLTLRFRFGEAPEDSVTVMENRRVPMAGSVFEYRDRILRAFATTMFRAGLKTPGVVRELMPVARLLRRRPRGDGE